MMDGESILEPVKKSRRSVLYYMQVSCLAFLVLYVARTLFIPLFMGLFIAIVMYPVCKKIERKGVSRSIAIFLCLLFVGFLIALLCLLFFWEIKALRMDFPMLQIKVASTIDFLHQWISKTFGVSNAKQALWLKDMPSDIAGIAASVLQGTVAFTINTLFIVFMVPVFTVLFLYSRGSFVAALKVIAGNNFSGRINSILQTTIHAYHRYVGGMVLVYLVVGLLNTLGLLVLGVDHAFLFGMLTAVMTIIPYVGIVVSAMLPISVAWISTGNIWIPIGIIGVFVFVQYLEANVIFPLIVGAQIHVSTWATLVAIIAGGILWGVAGMVLFMPFVAVLKIVSDHVSEWKALNVLLRR